MKHKKVREEKTWGTYGKSGNEPVELILIKNLSDSHLLHIIGHLLMRQDCIDIIPIMLSEARYRAKHNIFVAEY